MGILVLILIVFIIWFLLNLAGKIEKRKRMANYNPSWKKIKLKDNIEELADDLRLQDAMNKKNPKIKKGKRGGRYTEDKTNKDGRPYRRYF